VRESPQGGGVLEEQEEKPIGLAGGNEKKGGREREKIKGQAYIRSQS